ncbi:bifunctional diaminohydroxyphosphoribosylaminopyrimidine deaminase/5-amino-6-(5-phosphoribosylamino)uracil reductase RibD [Kushneria phosphatilytica]|uniref:Riboflavin biosynthesis protein RibD n=1 Tax=Kushneria phosphatilytica TaxID=657387 RepID=A0A1S1NW75_9GAMM|nr:bifunctional diaminohydroxyphosphoribosylaminopyrimidine deaminase/5-amino-6-(5-phosphoribosylamino)uracil reductase RibD [Kushneria phosphatilytica]OHV09732.1 riboflavin biosynthesis protein RibD [Kushneria phosphatilytica]QEL11778.1 bifunctional diaminohydroxyphosphoribosylaminopyrimidine deaminase/5-amino-6-(5-phosphoribosylamino)uracil reductase RibD [Kushneria phosphatilytica]
MNRTDATDARWMARALELARRGLYTTHPNPRVGCVLVHDGRMVGEGWHERAGEPHAEVNALRAAGEQARGATAYVTLEPCSHQGRTGPCARALVEAGVARVVVAMRDPNPAVSGRGLRILEQAGITVECGLMAEEATALNPGFIKRMAHSLPFVRLKMAMSLDGRTAMASGESQWITGAAARGWGQRLRAQSSAILSGVDAVSMDGSRLTVRQPALIEAGLSEEAARAAAHDQLLRVVVDSTLRLSPQAPMLAEPGRTLVATLVDDPGRQAPLREAGAELIVLPAREGRVDLMALMRQLVEQEACNELLLESGPGLAGAMLAAGLVDELKLFMAPTLLGSDARGLLNLPGLERMDQQQTLVIDDIRAVGDDWCITARPCRAATGAVN